MGYDALIVRDVPQYLILFVEVSVGVGEGYRWIGRFQSSILFSNETLGMKSVNTSKEIEIWEFYHSNL